MAAVRNFTGVDIAIRYRSIIGLYINRCSPSPYKVYGNIHQSVVIRNSTWLIE